MSTAANPPADGEAARVWLRVGPLGLTRRQVFAVAAVIVAGVLLAVFWGRFDIETVHAQAEKMPAVWVIALICFLPLIGFPVSWLHLAAGVRFDFWPGLAVVAFAGAVHHALGWALVKVLPARYFARLEPWRKKLQGAGHRDVTVLCGLLPGMPYSVQLYLLPIMGVPLTVLCFLGTAVHTGRATVTILLGNMSDDLTPGRIATLAAYYVVLAVVSALTLRHLRRSLVSADRPVRA